MKNIVIDIRHLAKLAKLKINQREKKNLEQQLKATIQYINMLGELKTKKIAPTTQTTKLKNITREDKPKSGLPTKQALANARKTKNNYFVAQRIKWG